jgi:hypothetical protein
VAGGPGRGAPCAISDSITIGALAAEADAGPAQRAG